MIDKLVTETDILKKTYKHVILFKKYSIEIKLCNLIKLRRDSLKKDIGKNFQT